MKVDFVITWVDGSDKNWLEEKSQYVDVRVDDAQRFRDWGMLKYWFRGVEKFAPWVNNIYFITWGHVPEFLNINHPQIKIVNHKDYLEANNLPTFNSNAIELSMHKIQGLSEHFVYFNDDMFLIKQTEVKDFFENGLPKDVAILNPIVPKYYNSIANIMANNMAVLNNNFVFRESFKKNKWKWLNFKYGKLIPLNILFLPWRNAVGLYQQHIPSSFLKSTFDEVWEKENGVFSETSSRKLRNNFQDINQWLIKEWQIMQGKFSPRSVKFGKYIMIKTRNDVEKVSKAINNKRVKVICVNDHIQDNYTETVDSVKEAFDKILGEKSSFEL